MYIVHGYVHDNYLVHDGSVGHSIDAKQSVVTIADVDGIDLQTA